jgi:hypothetical protein
MKQHYDIESNSPWNYNLWDFRASPDHNLQEHSPTAEEYLQKAPEKLTQSSFFNSNLAKLLSAENDLRTYDWIQSTTASGKADKQLKGQQLQIDTGVQKRINGHKATFFPDFMTNAAAFANLKDSNNGQLITVAHQLKEIQSHSDIARSIKTLGQVKVEDLQTHLKANDSNLGPMKEAATEVILALRQVRTYIRKAANNEQNAKKALEAQVKILNQAIGKLQEEISKACEGFVNEAKGLEQPHQSSSGLRPMVISFVLTLTILCLLSSLGLRPRLLPSPSL